MVYIMVYGMDRFVLCARGMTGQGVDVFLKGQEVTVTVDGTDGFGLFVYMRVLFSSPLFHNFIYHRNIFCMCCCSLLVACFTHFLLAFAFYLYYLPSYPSSFSMDNSYLYPSPSHIPLIVPSHLPSPTTLLALLFTRSTPAYPTNKNKSPLDWLLLLLPYHAFVLLSFSFSPTYEHSCLLPYYSLLLPLAFSPTTTTPVVPSLHAFLFILSHSSLSPTTHLLLPNLHEPPGLYIFSIIVYTFFHFLYAYMTVPVSDSGKPCIFAVCAVFMCFCCTFHASLPKIVGIGIFA